MEFGSVTTTEDEKKPLEPFTHDDAKDEKFCILCEHYESCPIVKYVNALEMRRNKRLAEAEFGCTLFTDAE